MNEQSVSGIEYLQWKACVKCNVESRIRKKQYRYFTCMMALFIFLIGSVLSFPLFAAEPNAQQAAIAAGVASGTDISVIIQNAVAAGMTVQQAVEAIVMAGADPGRVVYEAITAKYSAEAVVKGAAAAVNRLSDADTSSTAFSTLVSKIISAAFQAGASASQINGWLADAGIPATVIASANTQSSQSPAPAEGYSAPTPTASAPLTAVIGGGGGGGYIGGSSIGAPQTKPASKTKP